MSDYVLIRKGRNIISTVLHALFNLVLGLGSVFITFSTASWIPGVLLVILSKWRMFASSSPTVLARHFYPFILYLLFLIPPGLSS